MSNLILGTDLSGRRLKVKILTPFSITGARIILTTSENARISESQNGNYIILTIYTPSSGEHNYQISTSQATNRIIDLPDDFGVITAVNEEAALYPYITRTDHEKLYLVTEDMARVEHEIKKLLISDTTNSSSNIKLYYIKTELDGTFHEEDLTTDEYTVCIVTSSDDKLCIPYADGASKWWCKVLNVSDLSPAPNTNVMLTVIVKKNV